MLNRTLYVILLIAGIVVAGCKEEEKPIDAPPPPNVAGEEVLRQIQEPQQRVRNMEQELLDRNRQQLESVDNL